LESESSTDQAYEGYVQPTAYSLAESISWNLPNRLKRLQIRAQSSSQIKY
jgi:hypothetical protein